jgi:hypothetical protein
LSDDPPHVIELVYVNNKKQLENSIYDDRHSTVVHDMRLLFLLFLFLMTVKSPVAAQSATLRPTADPTTAAPTVSVPTMRTIPPEISSGEPDRGVTVVIALLVMGAATALGVYSVTYGYTPVDTTGDDDKK